MIGRYRTVNDRVICVVQKAKDAIGNNNNNVSKYKRSGKAGRVQPYVFEVPDQVFHFVSILLCKGDLAHFLLITFPKKTQFLYNIGFCFFTGIRNSREKVQAATLDKLCSC